MNGWADPDPGWWLNLQAHPDAIVDLASGSGAVRGRAANGAERSRLWGQVAREIDERLDAYAARPSETVVVILEPQWYPS
jgi:F420H(2)-dependent quinone reductase